jgi:selenocysteine-specific elongation factor
VEIKQIERGSQIAEIGYLQSLNQMGVTLLLLGSAQKPITQNQRIRIHLGTQEVMARVALTDGKTLQPVMIVQHFCALNNPWLLQGVINLLLEVSLPLSLLGVGK